MKKIVSILVLLILLFFVGQLCLTFFKKGHEVNYKVSFNDKVFDICELYSKKLDNSYNILIKNNDEVYYYTLPNEYNKQKKIIKSLEYFSHDNITCIYPILIDGTGTYLQCLEDGKRYSGYALNNDYINEIKNILKDKGYNIISEFDTDTTKILGNSTIYTNNLLKDDFITLWNYKGIQIISKDKFNIRNILSFDKYQNNHGYLVDKYYIIPEYLSSKVLEFSKVTLIDVDKNETKLINLGYTLSSSTYINGVVDNKIYYTDPVNLIQLEINPINGNSRLIGSKELGGQIYNGKWQDNNIYNFVDNEILFNDVPDELNKKYSYEYIQSTNNSYYFYNDNGIYQVPKENLDISILLFKTNNLNNFNVVNNTIYYVVGDTLYYFNENNGSVPVLKNNELRFNKLNRINIYRKS